MVDDYQCFCFVLFCSFFRQEKNSVVTQLCPGFIADSTPNQINRYNDGGIREGEDQIPLLQLNGLSMGRGDLWIKTDPSDVGYDISIHVSL